MTETIDIRLFFNFRSPYCYLASKTLWDIFEDYDTRMVWRPLGGWSGRSDPERFKMKVAVVRQDVRRFADKLGIPFNPPPVTTDPTRAGAGSLLAEKAGVLKPYVTEVMHAEWGEGRDIGDLAVLRDVANRVGFDPDALEAATSDPPISPFWRKTPRKPKRARPSASQRSLLARRFSGVTTGLISSAITYAR